MPSNRLLLPLIPALVVLMAGAGHAQKAAGRIGTTLTVLDQGNWRSLHKGIEHRKITLQRSEPNYVLEMKVFRFDPKETAAQVLDAGKYQLKGAEAKVFAEKSGALATINANYFDEKGRPLAYLKTTAKEINRSVSKHPLYTGVFAVRDGTALVMHRDEFVPAEASEALQSGPLLLLRGALVETMPGLGRYARRAVVGVDKNGRVLIAVTDTGLGGLSFVELQELFSQPRWQLETPDLLNLDGGSSAQLYVKAGKYEESVPGLSEVPVAIGFFAK